MSPAEAHARLQYALAGAAAAGRYVPCTGRDRALWVSDDAQERAVAAELCAGCPVLTECSLAAESTRERWHVWGGIDREAASKRRRGKGR